jgi:sterol desaturase/sphingolipid hydroxylase (fatty acid hydroxylase superfamily)
MDSLAELRSLRALSGIGILVLLLAWETLHPFLPQFARRARDRDVHGFRNVLFGVFNSLVVAVGFATLWTMASAASAQTGIGLLHRLDLSPALHAAAAVLVLDFWTYWWHWINHRVPFFWRFHRMHHSDPQMDVTTANRFHTGEIIFSSILRVPVIFLVGIHLWELVLYETLMFAVVQFHHANVGLPERFDRILRAFIPTPAMHKVHHSRVMVETNSNYSSLLSVWDRLFRTFRLRKDPREIEFGLDEFDDEDFQKIGGLARTPFVKAPVPRRARGVSADVGS